MDYRSFQLGNQWSTIYYPIKPSGFGVLILGDDRHFVNEETSFWNQNTGKREILSTLREAGYTLFTSNLYGKHWGSERAVLLAAMLYEIVMKNEILNTKIHILAEGMGALAALKLSKELKGKIRSIVLINPILSLDYHIELEKEQKFFYKKVLGEIGEAYGVDRLTAERMIREEGPPDIDRGVPIRIFHILTGGRTYKNARACKNFLSGLQPKPPITESYMLPEKAGQLGMEISRFMSRYEKVL
ncbi:hydrolase [Neobacillus piezotolerans]|uniref:Hydrolase n=1 Tax=Neobacillus piezotolerans TaxID=2259171 RepID=A0A3D8GM64_9BACI|nr:hydrolase [Neobacillus piezotolerans]RDU35564.1 hydrolase [Neobacillus piezotolerans]